MEDSDDIQPACIYDIGSSIGKIGFAGDRTPQTFPTIIGVARPNNISQDVRYGDAALRMKNILKLIRPVKYGLISDWKNMEKLLNWCFESELNVDPSNHCCLLTEPPFNVKRSRQKCTEIMMEKFNVPGFYMAQQAVLSLLASNRNNCTNGIVLDSGHESSYIVPIHEGYAMPHAISSIDITGNDITRYIMKLLSEQGYSWSDFKIANSIKEKLGYIAMDLNAEMIEPISAPELAPLQEYYSTTKQVDRIQIMDQIFGNNISQIVYQYLPKCTAEDWIYESLVETSRAHPFELPDGQIIKIGSARFKAPEIWFQPELIGKTTSDIPTQFILATGKCDEEMRQSLYSNIVLSGGNTLFPGLARRIKKELKSQVPDWMDVNVVAPPRRHLSSWIGGSLLASSSDFADKCLTQEEYDEEGPRAIHKKCQ